MSDWKPIRAAVIVLSVWAAVSGGSTFAKTQESDAEKAQAAARAEAAKLAAEAAAAENARLERERNNKAMQEFLTDSRTIIASANAGKERQQEHELQVEKDQLRAAFLSFQASRRDFAYAVTFKKKLQNPARAIEKSSAVFIDFIRRRTKERASFEESEFKKFTADELRAETLITAERLAPSLLAVMEGANATSIDIRFIQSLPKLEAELLRLQWLTRKVK